MSSRPVERLKDVKRRLKEEFTCRTGCGFSAHGVTFKSPTAIENEDMMVMKWANVNNDPWAFIRKNILVSGMLARLESIDSQIYKYPYRDRLIAARTASRALESTRRDVDIILYPR